MIKKIELSVLIYDQVAHIVNEKESETEFNHTVEYPWGKMVA